MRTLTDLELKDQTVLLHASLDVPVSDGRIVDDTRLRAALPSINHLLEQGCSVIILGHRGRPKGPDPSLSTRPCADRLSELLEMPVLHVPTANGKEAQSHLERMPKPGVAMLENIRFDPRNKAGNPSYAEELAEIADAFVSDDYPSAHRSHAVNTILPTLLPSAAGECMRKEFETITDALQSPKRPLVLIIGGAKADKIGVINNILGVADTIIVGGVLANTFLKASGSDVKASKVDDRSVEIAGEFLREAEEKFMLPIDAVAAAKFEEDSENKETPLDGIPDGWTVLDIGSKTLQQYTDAIKNAGTVIWGGPIGVFEWEAFRKGTEGVAKAMANTQAFTLVAGGDSGAAVHTLGLDKSMNHLSIGGGATLALIAGEELPAIEALR